MNILLIGTGAIGCFFGGKLAKASPSSITFFSRGESYKQIKEEGLVINSTIEQSFTLKVSIIETLPSNPSYDLVIITTKSYDVLAVLSNLPASLFANSYFMTTQNGISSEDLLLEKIDKAKLIPASAFVGVKKTQANTVCHTGGGRFQFGSYDNKPQEGFLGELFSLFKEANIDVSFSEDIMKLKWGKLVWNAAYNPISTITKFKLGSIVKNTWGESLLRESMNETAKLAKEYGHNISKAFIDKQIDLPENLHSFKTSMLQDYLNKRPLELETILGDLLKKAEKKGIELPLHRHCYNIIQLLLSDRK